MKNTIVFILSQPLRFAYRVLLHGDVGLNWISGSALIWSSMSPSGLCSPPAAPAYTLWDFIKLKDREPVIGQ